VLLCLPLLSQQLQLCASPPRFRVFGVSFHPPGFLLRLLSCAPSTLYSTWVLFCFLVSFPWFWVSLSSFLLLSPLLEPSLLFFFLSVRSLLGAVAVTPQKKKRVRRYLQVLSAERSKGYIWLLSLKVASWDTHTLGTFQKYSFFRPPSTTSGTLYRLYANILRELVTKWCVENRKVPDTRTQFSFYPDLNTILSMFILRHLVHAAKQIKPKGCSHLHTAFFNDSKQAYDTIIRPHLWDH